MDKIIQNLKGMILMKTSGATDRDVAEYIGMPIKTMLEKIEGDPYLKDKWENATERFITEVEQKFLENLVNEMEMGKMGNARWFLERRSEKYNKKETVDVNVTSIDEIIKSRE